MLVLENLTKRFGANVAVDKATFKVDRPIMLGIIGRSGAGKSTLLRMMNRLTDASEGTLMFEGRDVLSLKGADKRAWQSQCAMIFQQFNLVPRMDVVSNVLHGTLNRRSTFSTLFNMFPREDIHRAIDILDRLGIAQHAPKRAEALSGGQQQRVGIARSLAVDPEVWLLDEPFSALDPLIRKQLQDELLELQSRIQKTILFVTHDFSEAVRLADRIAIMRDGRIIQQGRAAELLLNPADDYVSRFVGDVSRLQVLKLGDIMEPAGRAVSGAPKMPASLSVEDMLLTTGGDVSTINVIDSNGRVTGKIDRAQAIETVRQATPGQTG